MSLPGHGSEDAVRRRVKDTPADALLAVNDQDYAVRVVLSRAKPIVRGRVATIDFDQCGSPATPSDFACVVEGCATLFGRVDDCSCAVLLP
ncbi:MAG: hypothetical protein HY270_07795 [Deltaproteobacteria bacterium]|nr:hypothetical protein [Deltaproteobacteria bacterium]